MTTIFQIKYNVRTGTGDVIRRETGRVIAGQPESQPESMELQMPLKGSQQ